MVIKLDVSKAYDSLNWYALIKVMRQFGFDERWIDMIWRLVSNVWYSVLVNGTSCGHFTSTRGLRQGDPLSHFLYIIASEVLSRGLNTLQAKYPQTKFYSSPNCPSVSHLSYADDLIIFCNGSTPSLKKHMELLDKVHKFLGLEINKSKSCYINERPDSSRDTVIKSITGFQKAFLPIEYLGCPLYRGRPTKEIFSSLISKIQNRVSGWMGKILTMGGKLTLIKSMLQALPLYLIALIKPPKSIIYEIKRIMSNFFWHDSDGSHKLHWTKWDKFCLPTEEGGLGLRDIEDIA